MYCLLCSYLIHVQRLLEKLKKNFASEDEEDSASVDENHTDILFVIHQVGDHLVINDY